MIRHFLTKKPSNSEIDKNNVYKREKQKLLSQLMAVLVKKADQNIHLLSKTEGASKIQSNCLKLGIVVTQRFTEKLSMWRLKPLID